MRPRNPDGMTRRRVLVTGAAVLSVGPPLLSAPAARADVTALRRSDWVGLVGQPVIVDGAVFEVLAVEDLPFGVAGGERTFSVMFTGPPGLAFDVPSSVAHPGLGRMDLFLAPVGPVSGGVQHYELVVDRSVRLAGDEPPSPGVPQAVGPPPVDLDGLSDAEREEVRRFAFLRSARVRRGRAELRLRRAARIRAVRVRLVRRGRVVARGRAVVAGSAVDVALQLRRPLRRGAYELVVTAVDAGGRRTTVRRGVYVRA